MCRVNVRSHDTMYYYRRYRRSLPIAQNGERSFQGSRIRIFVGLLSIVLLWNIGQSIVGFFSFDALASGSGILTVEDRASNVQVSVEDGDLQRAESGVKLYPGDTIATHTNGRAHVKFFNGTMLRCNDGSTIKITEASKTDSMKNLGIEFSQGELWVKTHYRGSGSSIVTIETPHYSITINGDSEILIRPERIVVLKAENIGVAVELNIDASEENLVVGEGQVLNLDVTARTSIENGKNPYTFRDPITPIILAEKFLTTSEDLVGTIAKEQEISSQSGSIATFDDIRILNPKEGESISGRSIHVDGKAGKTIARVTVNGHSVTTNPYGDFSADVAVERQGTTVLRIEGFTSQGLKTAEVVRSVETKFEPFSETVTFIAPTSSGQVFTTKIPEVQITGLAPAAAVNIFVNNYKLQLFKPGAKTWSYIATLDFGNLKLGENIFSAYAVDEFGNRSAPTSITVLYAPETSTSSGNILPLKQNSPKESGSLDVINPKENVTSDRELRIDGTTSKNTASITVNGYMLQYYTPGSTSWSYIASVKIATMHRGRNVYRIESRDAHGDVLDVLEYTLIFRP